MSKPRFDVHERPPLLELIPLSFQHVFAMFGATVLVPLLTGLSPAAALLSSGLGTLVYLVATKFQVPNYVGSSFAFIAPVAALTASGGMGMEYAMGGAVVAGLFYVLIAGLIRAFGLSWLDKVLPPVVIGAVIIVIGLALAPVAMQMATGTAGGGTYNLVHVGIAAFTLSVAIVCSIVLRGFFTVIPILIAIIAGYVFTLVMGMFNPAFALINLASIEAAPWIALPTLVMPKFDPVVVISFIIVSFATISEHLGHTLVTGMVVGKDFYKKPGIHRTLIGDGLATSIAAFLGGPPNTTYGENIGVMAINKVYSIWVIAGAAVVAIVLAFIGKFAALISTIPTPVMGGISTLLFGIIASTGIRTVVEQGVDYSHKRNLTITSVILVIGIGGGALKFVVGGNIHFDLEGIALATIVGILLNLILPKRMDDGEKPHPVKVKKTGKN